jgi:glycosyltransferase involved in cell wall biosynthesis
MADLGHLREKPVYIYTHGVPAPTGSGSKIRHYTNIRAYLDLGFEVEVVHFSDATRARVSQEPQLDGLDVKWTEVACSRSKATLLQRVARQAGFPREPALNASFKTREAIQREVQRREEATPGAIHHFEYLNAASAVVGMESTNAVWSCPDLQSERHRELFDMREEIGRAKGHRERKVRIRNLRWAEKEVASSCNLVLTIAKHENEQLRRISGCEHIELFPMSWPRETRVPRAREWREGGKLVLLHLGTVSGMSSYHSLDFLLGEVLPCLPEESRKRIELLVAGRIRDNEYTEKIRGTAAPYSQVEFLGYVENLIPYYASADLQVVGSTVSTGLRTRIIESFVYGLPVLSAQTSALGVVGCRPGENILLADDAASFAALIEDVVQSPACLEELAQEARKTYQRHYSRGVASEKLARLLKQYIR